MVRGSGLGRRAPGRNERSRLPCSANRSSHKSVPGAGRADPSRMGETTAKGLFHQLLISRDGRVFMGLECARCLAATTPPPI
ncbi:hypothetical protein SAMN03159423_1792 [Bradyrhizobium sp. NFR13]|nr:hypothetical protein SAMN03159423_1792 [Bradyrhizobium sp. NFR13]